jgi:hypothetical protein
MRQTSTVFVSVLGHGFSAETTWSIIYRPYCPACQKYVSGWS